MTAPPRTGGRTSQGRTPQPAPDAAGHVRPASGPPPAAAAAAVPRTGGRTQQGTRTRPRGGGRTQQGTQGGATVKPGPATAPAEPSSSSSSRLERRWYRREAARQAGKPVSSVAAGNVAGGLLALFAYPVLLNLIRGGTGQAAGWFSAKFFNEPYQGTQGGGPVKTRPRGKKGR